jgi:mRNA-degrading endonuclease toxin of MazEF toxin-antitoxin module
MAERGDVLALKRRLGFGKGEAGERVVVVQATPLCSALPTLVVVPLASDPVFGQSSLSVRVSAVECGSSHEQFALPSELRAVIADRLAPGRVGRLRARTLSELDQRMRLVLDL